ncbi:MAG: hypothetical protein K0R38_2936 [Polyangiaceae bacterium]|jgi:hypothetical protein|nr:hypothetical protein [Polyangiaceae bacterium]
MRLRKRGTYVLACLSLSACVAGSASVDENVDAASSPLDTVSFFPGRGYLLNADKAVGDCLTDAAGGLAIAPVRAANVGGQEVTYTLSKVESSEDLQKKLNIDASASASFLIGSADAKFSFAETTKTSSTAVTLLASVKVRNTSWTVPPGVKFHPDSVDLLKTADLKRFRERCGDGFLHSYTTGGEFHAIVQIQTSSAEETQKINASIEGSLFTASGSVEFNRYMESVVKNASTVVNSYQVGGTGIETTPCRDVKCVADRVVAFTTAVSKHPVVISAEVLPYDVLSRPADKVSPLDISVMRDTMREVNKQRNWTRDKINQFVEVQSRPEVYALGAPNATLAQITDGISTLNKNLTTYNDSLKTCARDIDLCKIPTVLSMAISMPPAKSPTSQVMLRAYGKPSGFVVDGLPMLAPCDYQTWVGTQSLEDRGRAPEATFKLVSGVSGVAGSVSLQSLLQPSKVLSAFFGSSCSKRVQMVTANTPDLKEKSTFFRVPGLNGKPNTWSFRLHHVTTAPVAGEVPKNRDANTYLSLSRVTPISVQSQPDTADAESLEKFRNDVSWYVEQQ